MEKPDRAITMYKKLKMYPDIIRLVKQYHGDMLEETYCRLAKVNPAVCNLFYHWILNLSYFSLSFHFESKNLFSDYQNKKIINEVLTFDPISSF